MSYKAEICTYCKVSSLNFYNIEKCDDVNTNKNDVIMHYFFAVFAKNTSFPAS